MQSHQQEHLTLGPREAILRPAVGVLVNAQQGVLLFHPEPGVRVCSQIHRLLTPHPQVSLCGETEKIHTGIMDLSQCEHNVELKPVDTLVLLTYHALVTTETQAVFTKRQYTGALVPSEQVIFRS